MATLIGGFFFYKRMTSSVYINSYNLTMKSIVYFTKDLSPKGVKRIFEKLNPTLGNKIAIKLHSGEEGNQNFLGPDFWEELIDSLNGVVVECNTAYPGARNTTKKHRQLISEHGWDKYFKFDLLDAEEPDLILSSSFLFI